MPLASPPAILRAFLTCGALVMLSSVPARLQAQRPVRHPVAAELRASQDGHVIADSRGERLDARVVSVSDDSVSLRLRDRNRTVALSAIDALWIRVPSTRRGAIAGGIVGALVGAVVALSFHEEPIYCVEGTSCGGNGSAGKVALVGAVLGGVPSALLGGALGRRSSHWRRVLP